MKIRKIIRLITACFSCFILFCALPFLNMRWNDWKLNRFVERFAQVGHPPGTQLLKAVQVVGLINGTGNQCDFLVAQMRSYRGEESKLRAFYRTTKIKAPDGEVVPVEVAVWKDARFDDEIFSWINELHSWFSPHEFTDQRVYVVYVYVGGYEPCLDVRCH